jgi:ubiquinone/menaquinone biosynthesis C-methylase UbiE
MVTDSELLRRRYEEIANTGDANTTACDFQLRELEIEFALKHICDGDRVLDVGCGPGVAPCAYASQRAISVHGVDYSESMVSFARRRTREVAPDLDITFQQADVTELPFQDEYFDIVTSSRCLMALLDWDLQQKALLEINRVLKSKGKLILMEGTLDGLERLNFYRRQFGLPEIAADGRDRLLTRKFRERELLDFCAASYVIEQTQRFGMYYFLTRVVQPLLVAPEPPRYDHPLNAVARQIAGILPDFEGMGHLVAFVMRKRDPENFAACTSAATVSARGTGTR